MDVTIAPDLLGDEGEGDLSTWLVADGDRVAADQPIAEIETSKLVVELVSPGEGTISLRVAQGDLVQANQTVASISA